MSLPINQFGHTKQQQKTCGWTMECGATWWVFDGVTNTTQAKHSVNTCVLLLCMDLPCLTKSRT